MPASRLIWYQNGRSGPRGRAEPSGEGNMNRDSWPFDGRGGRRSLPCFCAGVCVGGFRGLTGGQPGASVSSKPMIDKSTDRPQSDVDHGKPIKPAVRRRQMNAVLHRR